MLAGFGSGAVARGGVLDWLLPKHDVQVITVTDTTPVGALLRPASATHPVYYLGVSLGYRDFGGIVAGEKIPAKAEVIKTLTKVLAKSGYIPATKDHPPSIALVWSWGTLNTDRFYAGSDSMMDAPQINRSQMLRFLGAYKMGLVSKTPEPFSDELFMPGLTFRAPDADAIYDISEEDLYVVALAAYDFRALREKKRVLLWTTKISCPSRGLVLPETLPAMLAIAGPYIGHETAKPVWINASDKFKPNVQVGDPKLLEYLDSNKLPIIEPDSSASKKTPKPDHK